MKVPNIKFNLKFYDAKGGEIVVRTMDDLRAKANLSDLYDYYKDGMLSRWLLSIGEGAIAAVVDKLKLSDPDADGVKRLTSTLGIELPESDLMEFVKVLQLQARLQRKQRDGIEDETVGFHDESYFGLLQLLVDSPDDFFIVRRTMKRIMELYPDKFKKDIMIESGNATPFMRVMVRVCPLIAFVLSCNFVFRTWLLPREVLIRGVFESIEHWYSFCNKCASDFSQYFYWRENWGGWRDVVAVKKENGRKYFGVLKSEFA